ncbi:MAG: hypothetical protein AB8F34_07990 [Akkermansiaceae bacterium]
MRSGKRTNLRRRGRTRTRNSRRAGRPTLREAFHNANVRAKQRANRRMGKRRGLTSVRAAIEGTVSDDVIHLGIFQRMARWLIALALLPLCIVTTRALFLVDADGGTFWMDLLRTQQFIYFAVGMFWMAGWFFTGIGERFFLYLYVLGHELTHAIFVYACLGKVGGIHVTADGGYVMTSKTNMLIALSPYFVPFWSVVVLLVSTLLEMTTNIPHHNKALYFLIGATWAFHLQWTLWMIPRDQPDLKENGVFFSLVVIYLANVLVLSVILCLAPGNLTWHHWINEFMDSWVYLKNFLGKAVNLAL